MADLFNSEVKNILTEAQRIAYTSGRKSVTTGELFLAIMKAKKSLASRLLKNIGVQEKVVMESLQEELITNKTRYSAKKAAELPFSKMAQQAIDTAAQIADSYHESVNSAYLLIGLLTIKSSMITPILDKSGAEGPIDRDAVIATLLDIMGNNTAQVLQVISEEEKKQNQVDLSIDEAPTLKKASRNLSLLAAEGQLDPVIGRDNEIDRALQILGRRTKNNPIFVGEPGVGKTAIAEGIALRIAEGNVPEEFLEKRIITLDIGNVVAGTKYRGEFEARLTKIIDEVKNDGNIILFIDEIHMLIGAGGTEGSVDASNILKPALSRGEIQVMGATTFDEYQKYIEKDRAFERRFAPINIEEPSPEEAVTILTGLKAKYEHYHQLEIENEAIQVAVKLSHRYINDRQLPDKAIDLIDEAASKAKLHSQQSIQMRYLNQQLIQVETKKRQSIIEKDFSRAEELRVKQEKLRQQLSQAEAESHQMVVTAENVAEVVSDWTNVPVQQLAEKESQRLLQLEKELHQQVIGQDEAVSAVARAIRRARSGLRNPKRPIGSFMFLGPTGVGKTELAKTLARVMFDSEEAMIRVDMSEFMSRENVSRLVGSAPGYVGYEEGGQLTEKVRKHPYSVLLLDEVEKAHPDVFNIMLQILDDGYVTDAKGRKVDFKNTIIIMTSNLGATELRDDKQVGFGAKDLSQDNEAMKRKMMEALKEHFRPEFLNRIDETVVFHSLDQKDIQQIVRLMTQDLVKRLAEQEIQLKLTAGAIDLIAKEGFSPEYGARPLQRKLQQLIEDRLAEALLAQEINPGDQVTLGARRGEIYLQVKENKTEDLALA